MTGKEKGNLLLRKRQYDLSQNEAASAAIASSVLLGKVANSRTVIDRAIRDHALLVDVPALRATSDYLKGALISIQGGESVERRCGGWKAMRPSITLGSLGN